jgi:glucosamine-phosphate N-acetyltransferase
MQIRKLSSNDYEEFSVLINEFRETFFTQQQFIDILTYIQLTGAIWVVEHEDHLIATATVFYERKFIFNTTTLAHIEDVCVKESFRKQGIGKLLMKHIFDEAKKLNCYKVTLDCAEHNTPFYRACNLEQRGFQMCNLTDNL